MLHFRWIITIPALLISLSLTAPVTAKVYVWKDADNKTHYCNDPDDVPAEHKENVRTIESQASSKENSQRTTVTPQNQPGQAQAVANPSQSPTAGNSPNAGEMEELMSSYRDTRQEMRQYRQSGGSLDSPEYNELKNKLIDVKRRINDARKKVVNQNN